MAYSISGVAWPAFKKFRKMIRNWPCTGLVLIGKHCKFSDWSYSGLVRLSTVFSWMQNDRSTTKDVNVTCCLGFTDLYQPPPCPTALQTRVITQCFNFPIIRWLKSAWFKFPEFLCGKVQPKHQVQSILNTVSWVSVSPRCIHGTCVEPFECECEPGWLPYRPINQTGFDLLPWPGVFFFCRGKGVHKDFFWLFGISTGYFFPVFVPQQRKLVGSSAQISSGVWRCRSQEQVPEVPEGSGGFRRFAGVGSGGRFRKVPESSGVKWCRFWRQVPESSGEFRCGLLPCNLDRSSHVIVLITGTITLSTWAKPLRKKAPM